MENQKNNSMIKCKLCGGWGKDLVKENGYCNHCNRIKENKKPNEQIKCKLCGGWGKDLVKENGYCNHCNRIKDNIGIKRKGIEMENNKKSAKL